MKCICESQPTLTSTCVNTINNWGLLLAGSAQSSSQQPRIATQGTSCFTSRPNTYKDKKNQATLRNLFAIPVVHLAWNHRVINILSMRILVKKSEEIGWVHSYLLDYIYLITWNSCKQSQKNFAIYLSHEWTVLGLLSSKCLLNVWSTVGDLHSVSRFIQILQICLCCPKWYYVPSNWWMEEQTGRQACGYESPEDWKQ